LTPRCAGEVSHKPNWERGHSSMVLADNFVS
jgi:hypothetical protein